MRAFLFLSFFLLLPAPAMAQSWYVGGHLGANFAHESELWNPASPGYEDYAHYDTGWGLGLAVGHRFGALRAEV